MEKEYIFVTYDERTYLTRDPDPDDNWDAGEAHTDFTLERVFLDKPKDIYCKALEKRHDFESGTSVFVVVVRYSTGNTFGHETGRGCIVEVCKTFEEAQQVSRLCESGDHPQSYTWRGYFESLEDVEIHDRVIY